MKRRKRGRHKYVVSLLYKKEEEDKTTGLAFKTVPENN
jgi:hypothetical protein